jgi:two-component system NtrC family response regulator
MSDSGGAAGFGSGTIIAGSGAMRKVLQLAERVAALHPAALLLQGGPGSGKELLARAIHAAGPYGAQPFVAVDCGGMPEDVLESELFGHDALGDAGTERKRGLLELAETGTLFLAEIERLPLRLQPPLLRAIEDRRARRAGGPAEIPVRCRIIAALNQPLQRAEAAGSLRPDLALRLGSLVIALPPLRERGEDTERLAAHFLGSVAERTGSPAPALSADARAALRRHDWPGNVRELKMVIDRAALLADRRQLTAADLLIQDRISRAAGSGGAGAAEIRISPEGKSLEDIEREAIIHTLRLTDGNQSAACRVLGISRPTLARKLDKYQLRA